MKRLVILFVLASVFIGVANADDDDLLYSTLQMQSDCRPLEQAVVLGSGDISITQTWATGQCWGAFAVIQTLSRQREILNACAPPESTRLEMIKVFLRYTDQHPEYDHIEAFFVAVKAFQHAYPCLNRGGK